MSLSNYAEKAILDHVNGHTPLVAPAQFWAKLHTADPTEDGSAGAATNAVRKAVDFGVATSPGGVAVTTADVEWLSVSTTEIYSHISIWDAETAGNCWGSGALAAPVSVTAGNNFSIPAGDGTWTMS